MRKGKLTRWLLRIVFLAVSSVGFVRYYKYKTIVQTTTPISYSVINKTLHKGRGVSYELRIMYKNHAYKVDVTSKMYYDVEYKVYPRLYYLDVEDIVISEWTVKKYFRVFLLFIGLSTLTFIPFRTKQ